MTRSSASKSKTPKVCHNNEHDVIIRSENDCGQNTNGTAEHVDSSSVDLSKKRSARDCTSAPGDSAPPPKKRLLNENERNRENASKRQNETKIDELPGKTRTKIRKCSDFSQRTWIRRLSTANDNQSLNSNLEKCDIDHNFVVASYNVSRLSSLFQSNTGDSKLHHDLMMEELEFIDADILCLQHIGMEHWVILEKALRENGYHGEIVVDGGSKSHGLATLYRASRFVQVNVDSGKLSKLCFEYISHNNGLDALTLNAIKGYLNESEPYMVTVLKDTIHDRLLIVGNSRLSTHKADLKCVQAVGVFWRIHDIICQLHLDKLNNNDSQSMMNGSSCWIFCGDFSDSSDSPVYQICRDGYPNNSSIKQLQSIKEIVVDDDEKSLIDLVWHSFQHPFTDSCNSYFECDKSSSKDFIWMSDKALFPNRVLLMPSVSASCGQQQSTAVRNTEDEASLSNHHHLSLACDVAFVI